MPSNCSSICCGGAASVCAAPLSSYSGTCGSSCARPLLSHRQLQRSSPIRLDRAALCGYSSRCSAALCCGGASSVCAAPLSSYSGTCGSSCARPLLSHRQLQRSSPSRLDRAALCGYSSRCSVALCCGGAASVCAAPWRAFPPPAGVGLIGCGFQRSCAVARLHRLQRLRQSCLVGSLLGGCESFSACIGVAWLAPCSAVAKPSPPASASPG